MIRKKRYDNRHYDYKEEWKPVLRDGYEHYLVSNWGYVCLATKLGRHILEPALEHEYARVCLFLPVYGRSQALVHQLVFESINWELPLPREYWRTNKAGDRIIHHIDDDKWHPAIHNLQRIDLPENSRDAYKKQLRQPRRSRSPRPEQIG